MKRQSAGAGGSDVGACRQGALQCQGGGFVCVGGQGPVTASTSPPDEEFAFPTTGFRCCRY